MFGRQQTALDPDFTYEASKILLKTDENKRLLGLAIETPDGTHILVGVDAAQLLSLASQFSDALEEWPQLREWRPFQPAGVC